MIIINSLLLQLSLVVLILIRGGNTTTEWYGDLRAQMNPPRSPAFSDVVYDEIECPMGMESDAIPDYVYFGPMVSTMSVSKHVDCLNYCIQNPRCVAVNFFEPMTLQEKGFCELLSQSQLDNPRLMRPFKQAIYYENIKCRLGDDDTQSEFIKIRPVAKNSRIPSDLKIVLKKLAAKVHEFNNRYRQKR